MPKTWAATRVLDCSLAGPKTTASACRPINNGSLAVQLDRRAEPGALDRVLEATLVQVGRSTSMYLNSIFSQSVDEGIV